MQFLGDFYEFDPSINTWTNLTGVTSGSIPPRRSGCGLTSARGILYLFGGANTLTGGFTVFRSKNELFIQSDVKYESDNLNDLFQYDPIDLLWKNLNSSDHSTPPAPRAFSSFIASEDRLFIFGGMGSQSGTVSGVFLCL